MCIYIHTLAGDAFVKIQQPTIDYTETASFTDARTAVTFLLGKATSIDTSTLNARGKDTLDEQCADLQQILDCTKGPDY